MARCVALAGTVAACLLAASAAPAAASSYTITDMGSLGLGDSEPSAINANGQATGFSYLSKTIKEPCSYGGTCTFHPADAFLYSNGTMTDLGTLGGTGSSGSAINLSGQVAGAADTKSGSIDAAVWTGNKTIDLGALAPLSSGSYSTANGINDSGQVVGSWATSVNSGNSHPWLYSNGTMTSLPEPSTFTVAGCQANAINNNGQIIGACSDASGNDHAELWQNGTVTTLGTLGGLQVTSATAINNNGQIAGWGTTSTGATHGFLDSNGTVTDLGANFLPQALNDNGVMIANTGSGPLIDNGGTVQNLNNLIPANSGYQIYDAFAINDNGQIVALASDATTTRAAVLLTPN